MSPTSVRCPSCQNALPIVDEDDSGVFCPTCLKLVSVGSLSPFRQASPIVPPPLDPQVGATSAPTRVGDPSRPVRSGGTSPPTRPDVARVVHVVPHGAPPARADQGVGAAAPASGGEGSETKSGAEGAPPAPFSASFLERYRIEKKLGEGGMGQVFLGTQVALNRKVAIKTLKTLGLDQIARFDRERQLLSRLHHPRIVSVFDGGEDGGLPFLVCEYVEGTTLKDQLRAGMMPLERVLVLSIEILEGLSAAHGKGIWHRDIKPDNIFITPDGHAKIGDFGLAGAEDTGGVAERLTQSGLVMGTPHYMSPEQAMGDRDKVDGRSDLYSLGIMLYEMSTGRVPFEGKDLTTVLMQHARSEPIPPRTHLSTIPARLEDAILRSLRKRRRERFQDADAFAAELGAALADMRAGHAGAATSGSPHGGQGERGASGTATAGPAADASGSAGVGVAGNVAGVDGPSEAVGSGLGAGLGSGLGPGGGPAGTPGAGGAGSLRGGERDEVSVIAQRAPPPSRASGRKSLSMGAGIVVAAIGGLVALMHQPGETCDLSHRPMPAYLTPVDTDRQGFQRFRSDRDGATLILVPAGEFVMGSDESEEESPPHRVCLPEFYIDEHEVTRGQFASFLRATTYAPAGRFPRPGPVPEASAAATLPATGVTWDDAQAYARWAGRRLPTEAEWEKAARGPEGRTYPWGAEPPDPRRAAYKGSAAKEAPEPVGTHGAGASTYGVQDCAGNVWEWCADFYDARYYGSSPAVSPRGPTDGTDRVARGGSFRSLAGTLRSSVRLRLAPSEASDQLGFRTAVSP